MLIETKRGRWVRVDDIVELYHPKGEHGCRAVMREGAPVDFYQPCSEVANALVPVVAAQPGYEALKLCGGDKDPYFVWRCPIIAWRCHPTGVEPVAVDEDDVAVVKCPDGLVIELACGTYLNEASWLEEAQEAHQTRMRQLKLVKSETPT